MGSNAIVLENLEGVKKKLEGVSEDNLDKALQIISVNIVSEAKLLCPVDTGRLRASIHHRKIGNLQYLVGTNVEYSIYVEFGTYKMRAQPYLLPAGRRVVERIKLGELLGW